MIEELIYLMGLREKLIAGSSCGFSWCQSFQEKQKIEKLKKEARRQKGLLPGSGATIVYVLDVHGRALRYPFVETCTAVRRGMSLL